MSVISCHSCAFCPSKKGFRCSRSGCRFNSFDERCTDFAPKFSKCDLYRFFHNLVDMREVFTPNEIVEILASALDYYNNFRKK